MQASSPQSAGASVSASDSDREDERVIVLGASGFLGRHVCSQLRIQSIEHLRVARTPQPEVDAIVDLASSPQPQLDDIIGSFRPTAVINCAGAVSGSVGDLLRGNVVAVHTLLLALSRRAPAARLVQLGSSAEYGAPDTEVPMNEDTQTQPANPYGFSKLAASELVLRARSQGMGATILRAFNVSGPESPASTMLGSFVQQLLNDPEILRIDFDSLTHSRDYVDVRDVAVAACNAAFTQDPPAIANIGRGEAVRTADLVKELIAVSGTRARLEDTKVARNAAKVSSTAVTWQCADVTTASVRLEWRPAIPLADSLRDTWSTAVSMRS
jgi:nucleoside-diphosphate-sugar epimerase